MDVRTFLVELGYDILEREQAWAECLLLRGEEAWIGRGRDRDEALRDAVLRALPSYAARKLLEQALAAEGAAELAGSAGPPAAASDPPEPAQPAPSAQRATVVRVVEMRPEVSPRREELLATLEELDVRIRSDRGELALCAPQRQRLVLLAWLARARACNDAASRDSEVAARVQPIIKTLRILSEAWWPGMIAAFRLEARPPETFRELRGAVPEPPLSWAEVADAAELAVHTMEEETGRDELGWADEKSLVPEAPDPDRILEELRQAVEAIEPLGPRQPKEKEAPPAEQLVTWIQKLRWIRRSVEDGEAWGLVAGRLRYWAMASSAPEVRRLVDPAYRPPRPWAALLAVPDERRKLDAEVAQALEEMPAQDASDDAIVRWLVRVLPLTTTHARRIEAAAYPLKTRIEAIDAAQIPESDRRIRRRLQKLKSALAAMDEPPRPVEEGEEPEAAPEEEAPGTDHVEIPDGVLERTRGRRALFISNRQDPTLRERLVELFDFAELDWTEATTRRIDSSVDSISADGYDLVLGATGFLNHKTDDRIRRACSRAGIPYFRVNRGRPQAVASALSRDLGVSREQRGEG